MAEYPFDANRLSADHLTKAYPEVMRLALSLDETAEAVGLSRRKLQQLIAANELPVKRVGRRVVVPIDSLRKWLADRAEGGR